MPYTYEDLSEKLEKLPEDLKDVIFGVETSQTLQEIGKKHNLHIDKLGELVNEVGLVMVGLTHPKDFIPNLTNRLQVDQMTARNIAEDVNEQIFKKVRESLMKIHGIAPTPEGVGAPTESVGAEPPKPPEPPKVEPKPLEISPDRIDKNGESLRSVKMPEPPATLPTLSLPPISPSSLAFEEKTREEVFRTPAETREKIEEPKKTIGNMPFSELKKEIKYDPYREPIE